MTLLDILKEVKGIANANFTLEEWDKREQVVEMRYDQMVELMDEFYKRASEGDYEEQEASLIDEQLWQTVCAMKTFKVKHNI